MAKYHVIVQRHERLTACIYARIQLWDKEQNHTYFQLVCKNDHDLWAKHVTIISVNNQKIPQSYLIGYGSNRLPTFQVRNNVMIEDFDVVYLDG